MAHAFIHKLRANKYLKVLMDLGLVAVVYFIGQLAVTLVIRANDIRSVEELYSRPAALVTAYVLGGLVTLGAVLAVLRVRKMTLGDVALKKPELKDIGYGFLGFGAYFLIVRILLVVLGALIPALNLNQAQDIGLKNVTSGMLPAAFIALAVLPPLSEELLFRGFLYTRLRGYKIGLVTSALIVSVLFGAMHGQWNISIDTFVLSMTMIYTMQQRRSLWVSITMHVLKNTLAFLALFIFKIV